MRKQNVSGAIAKLIKGVLATGFSVQIVLGILWMCGNFTTVQKFAESDSVVYGALYALTGRHAPLMYLLQLGLACFSAQRFLGTLRKTDRVREIWSVLALVTYPFGMQCHMALLPWSFAGSLFLLELACGVELLKIPAGRAEAESREKKILCGMGLFWVLLAMLLPEYRVIGAVPVVCVCLYLCLRGRRRQTNKLYLFVLPVISLCLAVGAGTGAQKLSGAEEKSFSFVLACRTVWPSVLSDYPGWPEELLEVLGEDVTEIAYAPDNMERVLKPLVEAAFDKKEADRLYRVIAENSWTHRTPVILTQMRWDVIGYAATGLILPAQLAGEKYDSRSGRNYEIMREKAPVLTKNYVSYSCWWFAVCVICAGLLTVIFCIRERQFVWRDLGRGLAVCILSAGVLTAWYTMQGSGIMDYKASFCVSGMWLVWALTAMREEAKYEEG